ncbi:hypothetical protein L873DRAFT_1794237 [Choiromyces venosus 120613-1]|uniref:Myb/SANT-like domain-containing protein n=1 Tax=Choiromyces venosus 120613-1 TaxID=1336337 RepID=A0A3N4J5E6_9PEZI|nr:hypothetical protein L873DRAFT_1794237 [Choiromyces venosus 120613-1]
MVKFNQNTIEEKKSVQQLKTHYHTMKQKWKTFIHLLNSSGFGWNDETGVITTSDSVWNDYLAYHSLENDHSIDEIFCNTSTITSNAVTHSSSQLSIQGSLSEQITDNEEAGNDDYIEELESEGRLAQLCTQEYEAGEDSLIEILEDASMISSRNNSRLESPVNTQQSPLTNRPILQINTQTKWNRSISVEISKEVSAFIVETGVNKHKCLDLDNTHSVNLLDDLP